VGVVELRVALRTLIAAVALSALPAQADDDRDPEVRVTLIPSAGVVAPGAELTVAVHYVVEPGWHIYWENPGDSGLATSVETTAPGGWGVGPVQYPVPTRFVDGAGLVTYGWVGDPALLVDLVAAEEPGPAKISVATRWLACKERCVVGEAERTVEVVVGKPSPEAVAGRDERFAAWRAAMPRGNPPDTTWMCTELGAVLHIRGLVEEVEFIPGARLSEAGGSRIVTSPAVGLRHDRGDGCSLVESPERHYVDLRAPPPFDRGIQAGPWGLLRLDDSWYSLSPDCAPVPISEGTP